MKYAHWSLVLAAAVFIGWAHSHTDEVPVVLGFVLLLSAVMGFAFPSRPWLTGFLIGIPPFIVETLAHFDLLHVPYAVSKGLPWAALLGLVPGLGGALFGSAMRHLGRQQNHAS
ncbi:MAG TPA: hypothetical protein VHC90_12350 [Bryobacteraceae bacterium]|nr:hypothetical protein [Bryobacteraceae bacterium]